MNAAQPPERWITRREAFARYGLTRKQLEHVVLTHGIELRVRNGKAVLDAQAIEDAVSRNERQS